MVLAMQLKAVVLPAPFGPISAVIEPRSTVKEQSLDGADAAEMLAQSAHLEHVSPCNRGRGGSRPSPFSDACGRGLARPLTIAGFG